MSEKCDRDHYNGSRPQKHAEKITVSQHDVAGRQGEMCYMPGPGVK